MLLVLFRIGAERYGLDARSLVEVLPAVALRPQRGAPAGCAGLLAHRERTIPVIDLSLMATGKPAAQRLSTRIVVAHYRSGPPGSRIGLLVEEATDAREVAAEQLVDPGIATPDAPYLGKVVGEGEQLVQVVELDRLLSREVREALFPGSGP